MLVITLFITSAFVNASQIKYKKNVNSLGPGDHEVYLTFNDWSDADTWDDNMGDGNDGDPSVNENGGKATASCKVNVNGEKYEKNGFYGKTYFDVPVTANSVDISYEYVVSYSWRYYSNYGGQGDWAKGHIKAKISLYEDGEFIGEHNYDQFPAGHGPWDVDGAFDYEYSSDNFKLTNSFVNIDLDKNSEYYLKFEGEVYTAVGLWVGSEAKCRAKLELDLSENDIGIWFVWSNRAPPRPDKPSGETNPTLGSSDRITCKYTAVATDLDGEYDELTYYFSFTGFEETAGTYKPGETATCSHTWKREDFGKDKFVKVRVRDKFGYSDWSDPLTINVKTKGKPIIYENLIERFPILANLLNNIFS